jgi:hypothetical protein
LDWIERLKTYFKTHRQKPKTSIELDFGVER